MARCELIRPRDFERMSIVLVVVKVTWAFRRKVWPTYAPGEHPISSHTFDDAWTGKVRPRPHRHNTTLHSSAGRRLPLLFTPLHSLLEPVNMLATSRQAALALRGTPSMPPPGRPGKFTDSSSSQAHGRSHTVQGRRRLDIAVYEKASTGGRACSRIWRRECQGQSRPATEHEGIEQEDGPGGASG